MKRSCPWCLEPLRFRSSVADCPRCGRPLGPEGEPEAARQRCEKVEAVQIVRFRRLLAWGAPMTAVLGLVVPVLHVGAVVVIPLTAAAHLVVTRVVLVRDAQRLLRPVRRMLNRWLSRFSFLWIGLPGYGAMTVPFVGAIVAVATFVVLTSIVHVSTLMSLRRERDGRALALWEKLVPGALAVLSIGLLLLLLGVAAFFGWSVMSIVEALQSR